MFAQRNNGKLILRIEDTDQKRLVKDSVNNIIDALNWSGIEFDEGPHIKASPLGPYIQSERIDIYKKYILELINQKYAYVCFYSKDRLNQIASSTIAKKSAAEYDKRFRDLDPKESILKMNSENCVVRLAMPQKGELFIDDLIRGRLKFDYNLIDDPIIIKSDGFPTYHFANVIDDHDMKISHVIRGEEWLPSLPKHIHLYNCFNWKIPEFAHLPLLLNQDKSKLSKRQGDVAVEDYIKKGYLKKALINFIALLGWHESNNQEFYTLDELKNVFSLDRVQNSGAVFDIQKLNWLNQYYINQIDSKDIIALSKEYIPLDWNVTTDMINLIKEKITKFSNIESELSPFFKRQKLSKKDLINKYSTSDINQIISMMVKLLKKTEHIDKDVLNQIMGQIASKTGSKGKKLWQPVRFIITGQDHGPDLASFMSIIGLEECLSRFKNVI